MRCLACQKALTDSESTRKFTNEQERAPEQQFVDLCNECFDTIRYDVETDDVDIVCTDSYQTERIEQSDND